MAEGLRSLHKGQVSTSCRIDRVAADNGVVALCISGRITKQEVDTLRDVIEEEASAFAIDLRNVDLVDREAMQFLAQRELDGTVLRNCSPYIREWISRERTEITEATRDGEDA